MSIHEECGVFGVISPKPVDVANISYYGLYALQHRGQESCGIVVNDDGVFVSHKDLGLVGDVFSNDILSSLPSGTMAVGHVRYGTTGGTNRNNCQPIEVNHQKGRMALAHNGNLSNAAKLRNELELSGAIFHTTSDTETIAYIVTRERLNAPSIEDALSRAMNTLDGAYSLVLMSPQKLICARDPYGFRPLCYGQTPDGIFISNGPGDPTDVPQTITAIKKLIGKYPIFGICLGHQIISLAYGAKTYKLKFGHRGGNHPVKNLKTNKIEITSQNHSYAVDADSLLETPLSVTHINLLDQTVEGVVCERDRVFSVQYHPESAPGPQDSTYLFDQFITLIKEGCQHAEKNRS